jgi:hypothetical protein
MSVQTVLLVIVLLTVVLLVLALVFYVVHRMRPGRFRLSVTLLKLASINIEVDAQDNRPGTEHEQAGSDAASAE